MYMSLNEYQQAYQGMQDCTAIRPFNEAAMYHLVQSQLRHTGRSADELQPLVKRLAEMHKESLQHETDRKRFRLVEQGSPLHNPMGGTKSLYARCLGATRSRATDPASRCVATARATPIPGF